MRPFEGRTDHPAGGAGLTVDTIFGRVNPAPR